MISKGIRGATTVDENTAESIKDATIALLEKMMSENSIDKKHISHVFFTLTDDLNADFPAKFARIELGWDDVAMLCFKELDVPNALKMCLRILIVLNCSDDFLPKYVYLKGAEQLRK